MGATLEPVYLIDGCRSPIGRGHPEKGIYRDLRADELAVQTLQALLGRHNLDPADIDDFYLGCVGQHLEQGKNLARLILLLSGLPVTIPGVTINRLCASSLTALQLGADTIRTGANRLLLAGGVEHLGHVSMTAALDYHPGLFEGAPYQWTNMGLTAEQLAAEYGISRREQDEYTALSNQRHFQAVEAGKPAGELAPIALPDGTVVTADQEPRLSSPETLAGLPPVFQEGGTVTAANASGVSDGAVMALIGNETTLDQMARTPLAEIGAAATVGLPPEQMGLGPVPAINRLLDKTGLSIDQIDLFEINEAFAVQVLACQRELGIPTDRLNLYGGAVALGHPLGMSGLRIALRLAYIMAERDARRGIAALCVGHGQGVALLLERTARCRN
ncbi:MAG: thiolase family protein [Candidatus Neomarinimicrobiota bacterium]